MEETSRLKIIRRILRISFQRPVCMTCSVMLAVISSLAYFVPYLAIYRLLRIMLASGAASGGATLRCGFVAFAGAALNVLAYFGALILSHLAAFHTSFDLKINLAKKLSRLPMGFHMEHGTGQQYRMMGEGIDGIQSFIAHKLPDMVASVVYPSAMILIILSVDWRFGLAMSFGIVLAYAFHYLSMGRGGAKHMMELYYGALDEMENAAVECVRGITVLKAFGRSVGAFQKLEDAIGAYTDMVIPYTRNWEKYMPWFLALIANCYLFLIPVALWTAPDAEHWADFAVRFIFYLLLAPSLASVIPKIGRIMQEFMRVNTEVERLDKTMDAEEPAQGTENCSIKKPLLQFSDVSFSYNGDGTRPALCGVSFSAEPGTLTAIVGPSGSGKSTVASLIARFWDADSGSISIDGTDIRNMPFETLMTQVGFVLQNELLFSQSVLENIRFGNKNASFDDVVRAAKSANCHDFISALPDGYDTLIGAEGIRLSSGQKQRIALARAILKDAPILVLDEATASQDAENEALIQEAVSRLICGKTVIMIAHRLSTVRDADQILVMEHGRICERGKHSELLSSGGAYAALWRAYCGIQAWRLQGRTEGGAQ